MQPHVKIRPRKNLTEADPGSAKIQPKRKKEPKIAKPSDAEIFLETYKRDPERTYKTDTGKLRTKYMQVQELLNAGKIAEANALVHGGKPHGRNWLVGRKGKKPTYDTTPAAPSDQYVQELSAKIKQDLEADLEAKVNVKVKENMSWMLKKLRDAKPGLKFNITDLCATASSDQDDNGTPFTQGGTDN
ncbi:hypothetical protein OROMI_033554 [Orobanche minor]